MKYGAFWMLRLTFIQMLYVFMKVATLLSRGLCEILNAELKLCVCFCDVITRFFP